MNNFICADSLEYMKTMPSNSVNLCFTSPPYSDIQKNYGDKVKKIKPDDYVNWFLPFAAEIFRVLKPTGSFVLNINDRVIDGYQCLYVYRLILALCDTIGFHLVRDYIWHNPSTPPNIFSTGKYGRTKKSHEYCLWFSKSDKWTFNLDPIRKPYSKDMLSLLNGKIPNKIRKHPSGHRTDLTHQWKNQGGADCGSVITISNAASNDIVNRLSKKLGIKHPARFPLKLAEFFVLSGSNEGDVILDPFSGAGTTGIAAHKHNRKFICVDINQDFCKLAENWMDSIS